jgi:MFS family permease
MDPHKLLWMGALMGLFVNGGSANLGTVISEAYPTVARATAQNTLFNTGRGIASLAPVAVGAFATRYSFSGAIALLASLYVVAIVATVFLIPELKGKELD